MNWNDGGGKAGVRVRRVNISPKDLVLKEMYRFRLSYRFRVLSWIKMQRIPKFEILQAKAVTWVNNKVVMKTQLQRTSTHYVVKAVFLREQSGLKLAKPIHKVKRIQRTKLPVVTVSMLQWLGPQILRKAGKEKVVLVEVPEDIRKPIRVEPGVTLTRTKADKQGRYKLILPKAITLTMNKQNRCVSESWSHFVVACKG
ncbi:MAG: hypothetical protein EP343_25110 [Deltaproteobacteria bacterium]|nr:MAG: hypothetical protein EP343_25110 [Deltaproteobacteria bacterium]